VLINLNFIDKNNFNYRKTFILKFLSLLRFILLLIIDILLHF